MTGAGFPGFALALDPNDPGDDLPATATKLPAPTNAIREHGLHTLTPGTDCADWFKVDLVAGRTYRFDSAAGTGNVVGWLYSDPAGMVQVATDDDSAGNGQFAITYTAGATQPYYLKIATLVPCAGTWSGLLRYAACGAPTISSLGTTCGPAGIATPGVVIHGANLVGVTGVTIDGVPAPITSGQITTFAGDGQPGITSDGVQAAVARGFSPSGLAVDAQENLYIADAANRVVWKVTRATGQFSAFAGCGMAGFSGDGDLATKAKFWSPKGLAVDAAGNVFIADTGTHRIRKVSAATGKISTVAGAAVAGFGTVGRLATLTSLYNPGGVAVDAVGNLFIADTANRRVIKVDAATQLVSTVAGDYWVSATKDHGAWFAQLGCHLSVPEDVKVDSAGNVYISDSGFGVILKIEKTTGSVILLAGRYGSSGVGAEYGLAKDAAFSSPHGLALDGMGDLLIADTNNQRIRMVTPSGRIRLVAGNGTHSYSGDGAAATSAALAAPPAVAVGPSGRVYVADYDNHRIRTVDPEVTVTAPPHPPGSQDVVVTTCGGAATSVGAFTYSGAAPPTIASIGPTCGPIAGGTQVVVNGTDLAGTTAITFGGRAGKILTMTANAVTVTTPPGYGIGGLAKVVELSTCSGVAVGPLPFTYTYLPTITSPWSTCGFVTGGVSLVIPGSYLDGVLDVRIGGVSAPITGNTTDTVIVTTPAIAAPGLRDVAVTTCGGTATRVSGFNNLAIPTVTGVLPGCGPVAGGTTGVVIKGTNLGSVTSVTFGLNPATITAKSATALTLKTPAGPAGSCAVTLGTCAGAITLPNGFSYEAIPSITGVATVCGPASGSTTGVVISGANLAGATVVTFGGAPAVITGTTPTTVTVTTPPGLPGPRTVVVKTCGGTATATGAFTYVAAPTITGLSRSCGPASGGTTGVTILGTNLTGATSVKIGGRDATITSGLIYSMTGAGYSVIASNGKGDLFFTNGPRLYKIAADTGLFSILAGTYDYGDSGDGGPAAAAKLDQPGGVAVDTAGNIFIADQGTSLVRKINAVSGLISTVAGKRGTISWPNTFAEYHGYNGDDIFATDAKLHSPTGLAIDNTGNLYIADTQNRRIRKVWKGTGKITTVAGNGSFGHGGDGGAATSAQLASPWDIAIDKSGDLYVADLYGPRQLRKVSAATGLISTVAGAADGFSGDGGAATAAALHNVCGVEVDGLGNVYIADLMNQRVRMVNSTSKIISTIVGSGPVYNGFGTPVFGGLLNFPRNLAIDGSGKLYIADAVGVRVMYPDVTVTTPPGVPGAQDVEVTTCGGTAKLVGAFTYASGIPTITSLGTICGPVAGGTTGVVINGANLDDVSAVTFGGNAAPFAMDRGVLRSIPGTDSPGPVGDTTKAKMLPVTPTGLSVDRAGNVYYCDTANSRVRRVNIATGRIDTVAGSGDPGFAGDGGPAGLAMLFHPAGVAIDSTGVLYIADTDNNRIRKVGVDGVIKTVAGKGATGFVGDGNPAYSSLLSHPTGVAVDGAGNVFIADRDNHRVRKISGGIISTVAGTSGGGAYGGDGGPATSARLNLPSGVAVDASGTLYIADTGNHRIRRVTATGIIRTVAGKGTLGYTGDGGSATAAQLSGPIGVAVDWAGDLHLAEAGNHVIRRVSGSTGRISTEVGTGGPGYNGDGVEATLGLLRGSRGVAVNAAGKVYIADTGNGRVRTVERALTVTTPQGNAGTCDVVVMTCCGGLATRTGAFTYSEDTPWISGVTVNSGPAAGGTTGVVISGARLAGALEVTIGDTPAMITGNSPTAVTVTTPAGSPGAQDVVVKTCGGSFTKLGGFIYVAVPATAPTQLCVR